MSEQDRSISLNAVLHIVERESRKWGNDYRDWEVAIRDIKALPPAPTTQIIDKSNFNQEQYKMDLQSAYECGYNAGLQAHTDGDLISRQAVLEYIEGSEAELGHSSENELVCQDIKELPPQEPKTGHWIFKHFDENTGISDSYWCSECNAPLSSVYKNYCPNCGTRCISGGDGQVVGTRN